MPLSRYNLKSKNKTSISILDDILKYKDLLTITVQLGISTGAVIIFIYCFFYINYIPSGLNLGDSVSYIFIGLGFGVIYSIFVFFHFLISYTFVSIFKEKEFLFTLPLIIFLVILFCIYNNILDSYYEYILPVVYLSFITLRIWYSDKLKNNAVKLTFAIILFLLPFFIQGVFNLLLDKTLANLGVKENYISISLNNEKFSFIKKVADEQDIILKTSCNIKEQNRIIHDVNILWSIGKESLIQIKDNDNEIKLAINNDDLNKVNMKPKNKCVIKEFRAIFGQGESSLISNDIESELDGYIGKYHKNISELSIYGFTDLKSYKKGGNYKLSKDRAISVLNKIKELKIVELADDQIHTEGLANFEYKAYCNKDILDSQDLKDCEGINRGVIIRLKLTSQ